MMSWIDEKMATTCHDCELRQIRAAIGGDPRIEIHVVNPMP